MDENTQNITLLVISINGLEKQVYYCNGLFCFDIQEAHLKEGLTAPRIINVQKEFKTFSDAFNQLSNYFPVFNHHLTFVHTDYLPELRKLIIPQLKEQNRIKPKSRSWFLIMI